MPPKVGKAPDGKKGKGDGKKGSAKQLDPNSPEVLFAIAQKKLVQEKQNLAVELAFEKDRFRQETETKLRLDNDLNRLKTRLAKTTTDSDDILTHKQREIKLKMERVTNLEGTLKELRDNLADANAELAKLQQEAESNRKRLADAQQLLVDKATLEDVVRQQDVVITKQEDEILRQSEMLDEKDENIAKDALYIEELAMKAGTHSKLRLVFGDPWMLTHTRHKLRGSVPMDRDDNSLTSMGTKLLVLYGGQFPDGTSELTVVDLDKMVWQTADDIEHHPLKEVRTLEEESVDHNARWGHAACAVNKKKLAIIGGQAFDGLEREVNIFNVDSMKWITPYTKGEAPVCERHASVTAREKLYVFGGVCDNLYLNDLSVLDFENMRWHTIRCPNGVLPPPRCYHSISTTPSGLKLWAFGGHDGVRSLNDLWTFDIETATWTVPITTGMAPSPRYMHAATVINGFLVIAGGLDDSLRRMRDIHLLSMATLEWEMMEDGESYPLPAEVSKAMKPRGVYSAFHGSKLVTLRPNENELLDELEVLELNQPENLEDLRVQRQIMEAADAERFEISEAMTFPNAIEVCWRTPQRMMERVERYKLMVANASGVVKEVCQGRYERFKVTGLAQSTEYVFCVKAIFDDGSHLWSPSRAFVTKLQGDHQGMRVSSAPPHGHPH